MGPYEAGLADEHRERRRRLFGANAPKPKPTAEIISFDAERILRRADAIISNLGEQLDLNIKIRDIAKAVCEFYNVGYVDLISERRTFNVTLPRQITFYLCRRMTKRSLHYVGGQLGNKDHTTVLHGAQKIERLIDQDNRVRDDIQLIIARIIEGLPYRARELPSVKMRKKTVWSKDMNELLILIAGRGLTSSRIAWEMQAHGYVDMTADSVRHKISRMRKAGTWPF